VGPILANGATGTLNATSITLSRGGTAHVLLTGTTTRATTARNYGVGIKATSNLGFRAKAVIFYVQGFSISTSPSSAALVLSGSSTVSTLTLASLNGFSGTVILTAGSSPSGP